MRSDSDASFREGQPPGQVPLGILHSGSQYRTLIHLSQPRSRALKACGSQVRQRGSNSNQNEDFEKSKPAMICMRQAGGAQKWPVAEVLLL